MAPASRANVDKTADYSYIRSLPTGGRLYIPGYLDTWFVPKHTFGLPFISALGHSRTAAQLVVEGPCCVWTNSSTLDTLTLQHPEPCSACLVPLYLVLIARPLEITPPPTIKHSRTAAQLVVEGPCCVWINSSTLDTSTLQHPEPCSACLVPLYLCTWYCSTTA